MILGSSCRKIYLHSIFDLFEDIMDDNAHLTNTKIGQYCEPSTSGVVALAIENSDRGRFLQVGERDQTRMTG